MHVWLVNGQTSGHGSFAIESVVEIAVIGSLKKERFF